MDTSMDVTAPATPPVTNISSTPKLMKSVYVTARIKGIDKGI